jgi:glutamate-1-semialdehyde 2,1-aminomutase
VPDTSSKLFERAAQVIPGGVNSPVRSWRAVGGNPAFILRGRGAHVFDADGRALLDFVGSWGPLILGHAPASVVAAVAERAKNGTSFGAPTPIEVELAELLVDALPSLEQVRWSRPGPRRR